MSNDIEQPNNSGAGKATAGIILLAVGVILLLQRFTRFDYELWPLWLVGLGLFIGAKSNFRKSSSFVLILLGAIFLVTENVQEGDRIAWPIAIIAIGLFIILRRNGSVDKSRWERRFEHKWDWRFHSGYSPNSPNADQSSSAVPPQAGASGYPRSGDDYLDAVSVFGGVKKTILSKDFKGGEIVNIFGGAELDFTQAEINGRVVIDITQVFGGTKIIVPSHWQVVSDMAAVFAGLDDKRVRNTAAPNSDKVLVLKGVSIFAGVDIRSF